MSESPIVFEELSAAGGKLGRVTLSVASTLNSLTLEMVDLLQAQLDQWRDDDTRLLRYSGLEYARYAIARNWRGWAQSRHGWRFQRPHNLLR